MDSPRLNSIEPTMEKLSIDSSIYVNTSPRVSPRVSPRMSDGFQTPLSRERSFSSPRSTPTRQLSTDFERQLRTTGIDCNFYLPRKEGESAAKNATLFYSPASGKLSFQIAFNSASFRVKESAIPPLPQITTVKTFEFELSTILGVEKGKCPNGKVPLPETALDDHMLNIVVKDRPEINLEFPSSLARDIAAEALPKFLEGHKTSATPSASSRNSSPQTTPIVNTNIFNFSPSSSFTRKTAEATLMHALNTSITKLTKVMWVELKTKRGIFQRKKFETRLLVTTSEDMLEIFVPPEQYRAAGHKDDSRDSRDSSPGCAAIEGANAKHNHSSELSAAVLQERAALTESLKTFFDAPWDDSLLTYTGFVSEIKIPMESLESTVHIGANDHDNVIEIRTEDATVYKLRVDPAEKRRELIVFLEGRRNALLKERRGHLHDDK